MMKAVRSISRLGFALVPLLFLVLILPISFTFDSLNYWMTRPTCLNCGSLVEYLKTSSLSAAMVAAVGKSFLEQKVHYQLKIRK